MNLSHEIFAEVRSFDSLRYFPNNRAACFKIQFDQEIRFEGSWELGLTGISIDCFSGDRHFDGTDLYVYIDIIDFSFVGGNMKQLLKRVSLGPAIKSGNRIIYHMNSSNNGCCCCHYKQITTPYCLSVEIRVEDAKGNITDFSDKCFTSLSLHFRRRTSIMPKKSKCTNYE